MYANLLVDRSYQLHNPDVLVDNTRSAYGGTCYSDLSSGQTLTVTGYDTASVTATFTWVASVTNAQVYAHPIDGYQEILATQVRCHHERGISSGD